MSLSAPDSFTCNNCGRPRPRVLDSADSTRRPIVTSDAQLLTDVVVTRTLCQRCACIEVHYSPSDRLGRYFGEEYDLSDEVQSNMIVQAGRASRKHDHIAETLFAELGPLSAPGRFLEIACGKGQLVRQFQSAHPEWECFGIDPSASSPGATADALGKVTFIRDCFNTRHFDNTVFDVIVAHGFCNRSPVLPELLKIRSLSRVGTLLSLELLVLEDAPFAPHVWDHPFMYLAETFEAYLAHAGFRVRSKTDCGSSVHYLCDCTSAPAAIEELSVDAELPEQTALTYAEHQEWWVCAVDQYRHSRADSPEGKFALFGAGLYNAVLLSLIPDQRFEFVIDEVKAGTTFFGLPVIDPPQAGQRADARVFVCSNPRYAERMSRVLDREGIKYSVVLPQQHCRV